MLLACQVVEACCNPPEIWQTPGCRCPWPCAAQCRADARGSRHPASPELHLRSKWAETLVHFAEHIPNLVPLLGGDFRTEPALVRGHPIPHTTPTLPNPLEGGRCPLPPECLGGGRGFAVQGPTNLEQPSLDVQDLWHGQSRGSSRKGTLWQRKAAVPSKKIISAQEEQCPLSGGSPATPLQQLRLEQRRRVDLIRPQPHMRPLAAASRGRLVPVTQDVGESDHAVRLSGGEGLLCQDIVDVSWELIPDPRIRGPKPESPAHSVHCVQTVCV